MQAKKNSGDSNTDFFCTTNSHSRDETSNAENELRNKDRPLRLHQKSIVISESEIVGGAALRMRKSRQRRREGVRVLRVEVGIDTVEALLELDYLRVEDIQDFSAVAEALSNFIESTTDAVACNGITLSDW
jgi:hypothetical protein